MAIRESFSNDITRIEEEATIFVSIPSYRDSETPKTLQHLFNTAKNPKRITVLVNEQNDRRIIPGKPSAMDVEATNFPGSSRFLSNIRLLQQPASAALGPVVARAQIEQQLYTKGEADYWLQIDSHSAFVKFWDVHLIRQHNKLPDPDTGILTTLCADYDPNTRNVPRLALPNYIGLHEFNTARLMPSQQRYQYRSFPAAPRKSLFFSGNFAFTAAETIEQVPYDPSMHYVFLGEEISMAARYYTHGFDLYNPTAMLIYHLTNRNYRPTFWEQFHTKNSKATPQQRKERKQLESEAMHRLQQLLFYGDAPMGDSRYGLGTRRSLQDYEVFAGLDFQGQTFTPRSKLGMEESATEEEWMEKHSVQSHQWSDALRNLKPMVSTRNTPQLVR